MCIWLAAKYLQIEGLCSLLLAQPSLDGEGPRGRICGLWTTCPRGQGISAVLPWPQPGCWTPGGCCGCWELVALTQLCRSYARSGAQGARKSLARPSSRMLFTRLDLQDQALVIGRKGDGRDKQVLHKMVASGRGLLEATDELQPEPSLEKAAPRPGRRSGRAHCVPPSGLVTYSSAKRCVRRRPEPAAASAPVPAAPAGPRAPPQPPFPPGTGGRRADGGRRHRAAPRGWRTELPPGVKHESSRPALRHGHAGGGKAAPGCKVMKEPAPARRQMPACPPAPRRARAGSGAGRPLLAAGRGLGSARRGAARRLRPQEMVAARGEAGGEPSWRRGAARAPASARRLLRPARGGLSRPRAGERRPAELGPGPRRRRGTASR